MKRIELLYIYLLNRYSFLENEIKQLQDNIRYRKNPDSVDCLELIIALERFQLHKEIMHHIFHIMNLKQFDEKYGTWYNYDDELEEEISKQLRRSEHEEKEKNEEKVK